MIVELTDEDLEQLQGWYDAAAGESCTGSGERHTAAKLTQLLDKLGLTVHLTDKYQIEKLGRGESGE